MEQETNGNQSGFWEKQQYGIKNYCRVTMQIMKTYTTSVCIENGHCEKMIEIDQHRGN